MAVARVLLEDKMAATLAASMAVTKVALLVVRKDDVRAFQRADTRVVQMDVIMADKWVSKMAAK
jgi:hypothetical protein